jgi:RNA polymerase sigma factor (sigma-70 family)
LEGAAPKRQNLETWVRSTLGLAVAYAASLLGDAVTAEDIVQDCYCRLLQKQNVYELERDGVKLLYRSISNACFNWRKHERRYRSLDAASSRDESGSTSGSKVQDQRQPEPSAEAMQHELEAALVEGLAKLPVLHRAAFELKSLGHSQQEIAAMLDITPTYAGVLVHRARQVLAEQLTAFREDDNV